MHVADGGVGKSTFVQTLLMRVSMGLNFGPYKVSRPLRCLWINREDPLSLQLQRQEAAELHMGIEPEALNNFFRWPTQDDLRSLVMVDENGCTVPGPFFDPLRQMIRDNRIEVLGIDPLVMFMTGLDENSNADGAAVAAIIKRLIAEFNLAVIVCHHAHKHAKAEQAASRGASSIMNASRCAHYMERDASGAVVNTNIKPSLGSAVMKSTWRWKVYDLARKGEEAAALEWQASAEDVATPDNRAIVLGLIAKGRDEGQPWHSAVRAQRSTRLEAVLAERFGMGLKGCQPIS